MAGTVGVSLHDRLRVLGRLSADPKGSDDAYDVTLAGTKLFQALGIDLQATRTLRRRFACACVDWSERRPHIGGALGAALLNIALERKWVAQDLNSRAWTSRVSGDVKCGRDSGFRCEEFVPTGSHKVSQPAQIFTSRRQSLDTTAALITENASHSG